MSAFQCISNQFVDQFLRGLNLCTKFIVSGGFVFFLGIGAKDLVMYQDDADKMFGNDDEKD